MNVADIQEEPQGKPWESEYVRCWEPAPFDLGEYERWASTFRITSGRIRSVNVTSGSHVDAGSVELIDPGLRRGTPYLDELEMNRPWFRTLT